MTPVRRIRLSRVRIPNPGISDSTAVPKRATSNPSMVTNNVRKIRNVPQAGTRMRSPVRPYRLILCGQFINSLHVRVSLADSDGPFTAWPTGRFRLDLDGGFLYPNPVVVSFR